MYYYSLSGDSLLCHGFENPTTLMTNERPELLMKFPVNYGDSTFCYYNGNGKYCDRLKISALGTLASKADAYGMMILPSGDTLKNIIRVHTVKTIAENTEPLFFSDRNDSPKTVVTDDSIRYRLANDTILLGVEACRWYVKGYRYPIFETVKSITDRHGEERTFFDVAFYYPPQEHYYLADDPDNLAELFGDGDYDPDNPNPDINPNPGETFRYNFYPNPVADILTVEYYTTKSSDAEIGIYDMHGKSMFVKCEQRQAGIHALTIDMQNYVKGNYILRITSGEKNASEIIVKK
jgi:hypothetical protein